MLHRLTVYNNVGLTSKASQEGEKVSTTPLLFDPPLQGNPANIRMNLILPETRVIAIMRYIFAADSVGLSSFKFLWWAPKTHVF